MAQKCSQAVEVLPGSTIEWLTGSITTCTARIGKNGRNILMPKVKQPNKTGGDPKMFKEAGSKWRAMTYIQKQPWGYIARNEKFRSAWHAFNSSFFRSVAKHGLDYTMNHELNYIYSNNRAKMAEQFINSLKRLKKYRVQPMFYTETEEMLRIYPVVLASPHIYIRLRNLNDINNALSMKLLLRTDVIKEYHFEPIEQNNHIEKGSYTLLTRPRQGLELFEPIH